MCSKMILIKQFLLVIRRILFHKMLDSFLSPMTTHIFHQVSVLFLLFLLLVTFRHKYPRQYRILRNIQEISSCDIIQPLYVLKVTHLLVNPFEWLFRLQVRRIRVLFYWNVLLQDRNEIVYVFQMEVKQVNLARFQANFKSVHWLVETSLTNKGNVMQVENVMKQKFVFEGLDTHVVEWLRWMFWYNCYETLLWYADCRNYHRKQVYVNAFWHEFALYWNFLCQNHRYDCRALLLLFWRSKYLLFHSVKCWPSKFLQDCLISFFRIS